MLQESIALSVILGFLGSEFLGLYSGGMVSAGYLSLYAQEPLRIVATLTVALASCLFIRLVQRHVILFGRRRFMAAVLAGFLGTWGLESLLRVLVLLPGIALSQDLRVIGYIVPGLVANDMLKQGIPKTLMATLTVAFLVRGIVLLGIL